MQFWVLGELVFWHVRTKRFFFLKYCTNTLVIFFCLLERLLILNQGNYWRLNDRWFWIDVKNVFDPLSNPNPIPTDAQLGDRCEKMHLVCSHMDVNGDFEANCIGQDRLHFIDNFNSFQERYDFTWARRSYKFILIGFLLETAIAAKWNLIIPRLVKPFFFHFAQLWLVSREKDSGVRLVVWNTTKVNRLPCQAMFPKIRKILLVVSMALKMSQNVVTTFRI